MPDSGVGSPATASPGSPAGGALGGGGSGALVFRGAVLGAGASRVLPVELRVCAWHELLRRALVALVAPAPSASSSAIGSTSADALDWQCSGPPFDGVVLVACAERPPLLLSSGNALADSLIASMLYIASTSRSVTARCPASCSNTEQ